MLAAERESLLQESQRGTAEWVDVPTACAKSSICRSRIYQLLNSTGGKIKTCSLKLPGNVYGRRLIHLPSLLGYLKGLANEQARG